MAGWGLEGQYFSGIQSSISGEIRIVARIISVSFIISFSYVPTLLNWVDLVNNKARLLQGEVIK